MSNIKDRIQRAKSSPGGTATKPIRLWLAPDMGLVEQYQKAAAELEAVKGDDAPAPESMESGSPVAELRQRVEDLRAQLDKCAVDLRVRALDSDEWQRILDEHPPRRGVDGGEGDPRDADAGWNTSSFPRALIRAATVAPDLDDDDWASLLGADGQRGVLTDPQVQEAATAVLSLSRMRIDVPFS